MMNPYKYFISLRVVKLKSLHKLLPYAYIVLSTIECNAMGIEVCYVNYVVSELFYCCVELFSLVPVIWWLVKGVDNLEIIKTKCK